MKDSMDPQTWELLMDKLERIENQNTKQLEMLHDHIAESDIIRDKVNTHSTYFKLVGVVIPGFMTYILTKLGLK